MIITKEWPHQITTRDHITSIPSTEDAAAYRDDLAAAAQPTTATTRSAAIPRCSWFCSFYSVCTPSPPPPSQDSVWWGLLPRENLLMLQVEENGDNCPRWLPRRRLSAATMMDYWMVVVVVIVIDDHQFVGGCNGDNYAPNGLPCGTPLQSLCDFQNCG